MEMITIHPKSKKQFEAIEAVLKAMKVPFKKEENISELEKENAVLRDFGSDSSAFSFWENQEEDIYQDYLTSKE